MSEIVLKRKIVFDEIGISKCRYVRVQQQGAVAELPSALQLAQ